MTLKRLAIVAAVAMTVACAPRLQGPGVKDWDIPEEARIEMAVEALEVNLQLLERVLRTTHRIREAGASECEPNVVPMLGTLLARQSQYEGNPLFLRAAIQAFDVAEEPTILALVLLLFYVPCADALRSPRGNNGCSDGSTRIRTPSGSTWMMAA